MSESNLQQQLQQQQLYPHPPLPSPRSPHGYGSGVTFAHIPSTGHLSPKARPLPPHAGYAPLLYENPHLRGQVQAVMSSTYHGTVATVVCHRVTDEGCTLPCYTENVKHRYVHNGAIELV